MAFRNRSDRRRAEPPLITLLPIVPFAIVVQAASVLRLTFDSPMQRNAVPALFLWTLAGIAGPTAVSAVTVSATVVDITFSAVVNVVSYIAAMNEGTQTIRGVTGGYASAAPRFILAV